MTMVLFTFMILVATIYTEENGASPICNMNKVYSPVRNISNHSLFHSNKS